MSEHIHDELAPALRNRLASRPDLRSYFDEVFLPTTDFTLETVFGVVLDWSRRGADREALKEALSGVLMKLVGRSLVVTTDIMLAAAQAQMHGILNGLADSVDAPNGIVKQLSKAANLPVPVSEIAELTADALRVGAEVLGPLDEAQRSKIRSLMYEVIDPLPSTAGAGFLQQLGDGAFIPNNDAMMALAAELAAVGGERFLQFVAKLIELIGTKILEELAEVLEAAQRQVEQWIDDAQQALEDMQRRLGQLLADIERLAREVAEQFDQAAESLLGALTPLATRSGRRKFKSKLAAEIVDQALAVLTDNHVYRTLAPPDLKRAMRGMARDAVEQALDNDVIDGVLDIVGGLAEELDSIMDDVRELDPDRDLAQQIGNLVINRLTDAIYDNLGRDPHIRVAFDVDVLGVRYRISLGRVDVPVEAIVDGLRRAVRDLDAFEDAVRDAAQSLSSAFTKEVRLQEVEAERADVVAKSERLRRQRTALEAAPRGVRVLSPTPGAVAGAHSDRSPGPVARGRAPRGRPPRSGPRLPQWPGAAADVLLRCRTGTGAGGHFRRCPQGKPVRSARRPGTAPALGRVEAGQDRREGHAARRTASARRELGERPVAQDRQVPVHHVRGRSPGHGSRQPAGRSCWGRAGSGAYTVGRAETDRAADAAGTARRTALRLANHGDPDRPAHSTLPARHRSVLHGPRRRARRGHQHADRVDHARWRATCRSILRVLRRRRSRATGQAETRGKPSAAEEPSQHSRSDAPENRRQVRPSSEEGSAEDGGGAEEGDRRPRPEEAGHTDGGPSPCRETEASARHRAARHAEAGSVAP
jgi:methyl-accepting chemotaxis protein